MSAGWHSVAYISSFSCASSSSASTRFVQYVPPCSSVRVIFGARLFTTWLPGHCCYVISCVCNSNHCGARPCLAVPLPGCPQEGLSGLSGDEANEGASPTGSNSRGGASPTGSHGSGSGMDMLGTSPPGGVYDVSLGEAMARYTNSLPEREFIHYNTHLS